jgi:hypothetical protein
VDEDRVIFVLQRVVEGVVPLVQEHIDIDDPEVERDDDEEQPPSRPTVLREPVWAGDGPSITKQSA